VSIPPVGVDPVAPLGPDRDSGGPDRHAVKQQSNSNPVATRMWAPRDPEVVPLLYGDRRANMFSRRRSIHHAMPR
jgi:hypothetical protein